MHWIDEDRLILSKPIIEKGERVGSLVLVAKYEATRRLIDSGLIVGAVMLLNLLIAVLLSTWLGHKLSKPIIDITEVAHRVMELRDFSVRVRKTTDDEIGYLVDTFNAMLDEVGRRAAALEDATGRKTSSSPCCRTSCATRSIRSAMRSPCCG
jgi:nitrate/nitrite-specific signal transduction histidine kinase